MAKLVTVGDVARQAIERLQHKDEALRELLSYGEGMRDGNESGDAREAYDDMVSKLRSILDGE